MSKETTIKNPILPGFHADPSILRVGDDWFIATSTFEWFPGIEIWHSKNLINWELIDRPLNRVDQLDLRGIDPSGGVWAPCLSFNKHTKKYNLVYSIVYSHVGNTRVGIGGDSNNYHIVDSYVVTTDKIGTPWSDRVYLNSSGFDQSFFHDEDGRTYLTNVEWLNENGDTAFNGIVMQEFDNKTQKMVGPIKNIYKGSPIQKSEGPHIYKREGYYYLGVAEGGTSYGHAFTLARSKNIWGPYETDHNFPTITSMHNKLLPLQKAGHGDFAEDDNDNVFLVCLVSRPLGTQENCPLGRETGLFRYKWNDEGWLENVAGKNEPQEYVSVPFEGKQELFRSEHFNFTKETKIPMCFQSSRVPMESSWVNMTSNGLEMLGRHASQSLHMQSQLMRRWQSFKFEASTIVEFDPDMHKQAAGIVHKYDEGHQVLMQFTRINSGEKVILMEAWDNGGKMEPVKPFILPKNTTKVHMKTTVDGYDINFFFSLDGEEWTRVPKTFDATVMSDDHIWAGSFTGSFVGMFAIDDQQRKKVATFKEWTYKEL